MNVNNNLLSIRLFAVALFSATARSFPSSGDQKGAQRLRQFSNLSISYGRPQACDLLSGLPLWVKAGVHSCPRYPSNMPLPKEPRCKPCARGVEQLLGYFRNAGGYSVKRRLFIYLFSPQITHCTGLFANSGSYICISIKINGLCKGWRCSGGVPPAPLLLCSRVAVLLLRSQSSLTQINGCVYSERGEDRAGNEERGRESVCEKMWRTVGKY